MDASIGLDELIPFYGSRRSESFLRVVGSDLAPTLPWGIFVTAVGIRATLLERRERKPGYDWREAVVIVTCGEARTTCHRQIRITCITTKSGRPHIGMCGRVCVVRQRPEC